MTTPSLKEQIIAELDNLSPEQQRQMLEYARGLGQQSTLPPGIPGEVLITRAKEINFAPEDLEEIARIIEEDCERIDWDEWE
jgi:hypothetical protein